MEEKTKEETIDLAAAFRNPYVQGALMAFLCVLFLIIAQNFFMKNTMWMDEGLYSMVGQNLVQKGTFHLYGSELTVAAPFLPFSIAIFYSLFGENGTVLNLLMLFYAMANIVVLFVLGRRLLNLWTGVVSGLFLAFSTLFLFYSLRILTDMPLMLFATLSVLLFWMSFEEKKPRYLPLLGAILAAGFLMKFTFPVIALPLAIIALWGHWREILPNWKPIALGAAVFLLLAAAEPLYNVISTGQPTGVIGGYISGNIGIGAQAVPFDQYFLWFPHVFSSPWVVLLLAMSAVYGVWKNKKPLVLLSAVLLITVLVLSTVMSWKEDRYILFLVPLGLVLASYAVVSSLKAAYKAVAEKKEEFLVETCLALVALFALASGTVLNYPDAAALTAYKIPSYGALKPAGEFIQTVTVPGEWIASNSGHELAYYADRYTEFIDLDIANFKKSLVDKNISLIAVTLYEQRDQVIPALQKFDQKTLGAPTNSYEYILAEFQIIRTINENASGQETTSVVIFKKTK